MTVVNAFVPVMPRRVGKAIESRNARTIGARCFSKESDNDDPPMFQSTVPRSAAGGSSKSNKFIRIRPRTVRGSRQSFELQTAVTTFERRNRNGERQTIELHAQLHFGTEPYFEYYNSKDFASRHDRVHYELLVDQDLMAVKDGLRYLPASPDGGRVLMSSASDANTAAQYGLTCQVDVMDFTHKNWVHADLTRQELLRQSRNENVLGQAESEPLWALASTAPTWPGAEAVSALFRPSTPSTPLSSPVTRRLFSNLFLPGNSLAALFRALFWVAVPSPELSVMVLDWSSILPRPTGGISQVALPVLQCLLTGNIQEARQLVFGQMIAGGQSGSDKETLLVGKRNDHALQVLQTSLDRDGCHSMALLYGGLHCQDLHRKLLGMGFAPTKTQWRTAWSVIVPSFGTGSGKSGRLESFASSSSPEAVAVGLVVLPMYLLVGGLDWIGTLHDLAAAVDAGHFVDASLDVTLYLVRHVMLYLGLTKFVVEWDGGVSLFGTDNR